MFGIILFFLFLWKYLNGFTKGFELDMYWPQNENRCRSWGLLKHSSWDFKAINIKLLRKVREKLVQVCSSQFKKHFIPKLLEYFENFPNAHALLKILAKLSHCCVDVCVCVCLRTCLFTVPCDRQLSTSPLWRNKLFHKCSSYHFTKQNIDKILV